MISRSCRSRMFVRLAPAPSSRMCCLSVPCEGCCSAPLCRATHMFSCMSCMVYIVCCFSGCLLGPNEYMTTDRHRTMVLPDRHSFLNWGTASLRDLFKRRCCYALLHPPIRPSSAPETFLPQIHVKGVGARIHWTWPGPKPTTTTTTTTVTRRRVKWRSSINDDDGEEEDV